MTKILILGMSQSNFLDQLYGDILKQNHNFKFSVDGFYDISKGIVNRQDLYNTYFDFKNVQINKIQLFKSLLGFVFTLFFYQVVFFEISRGNNLKKVFKKIKKLTRVRSIVRREILKLNFDIYHFHFMIPPCLEPIYFLPKKSKTICSFWGSDLLRNHSPEHTFYVGKALSRASVITIQTPELGTILFNRFGDKLAHKTKFLRFTLNAEIFEEIEKVQLNPNSVLALKNKYTIDPNKVVVALGHNGFAENNHLLMLEAISLLPLEVKRKIVLVLHFAYGGNEDYFKTVKSALKKYEDVESVFIEDYFDKTEIASLRKATDILIQMPVSDALSGAMTEVVYAGNIVLYGSWLPYKFFSDLDIKMTEVKDFYELTEKLTYVIQNIDLIKASLIDNAELIRKNLFSHVTTSAWIEVFESL